MKKTKTQAFANLIGSLIFIAVGVWALIHTAIMPSACIMAA